MKILFICLGNICRSAMAEYIFRDLAEKEGCAGLFTAASAGTSVFNNGSPMYGEAQKMLRAHGIDPRGHHARKMRKSDYGKFDLIIGMDEENLSDMRHEWRGDPDGKLYLLLDFTQRKGAIADPWYTGDFETAYRDILEGCKGLLSHIQEQGL